MFRRMLALVLLGVLVVGAGAALYGTANGIPAGSVLAALAGQGSAHHGHGEGHDNDD